MKIKRKNIFLISLCILFLFVTFTSLFYVIEEANHNCSGEDCPICVNIHQTEQTLRNIGNGTIPIIIANIVLTLFIVLKVCKFMFVSCISLVNQKVRLNN